MPKDIRSYFTKSPKVGAPSQKPKPKSILVISSDEDDHVKSKSSREKQKVSKVNRRRQALSDSDEEAPISKSKEKTGIKDTKKEEELKPVAPGDIFGKKGISRVSAPAVSKKLQENVDKQTKALDDAEFEANLTELDISDLESKFVSPETMNDTGSGKRKRPGDSEDDGTTKKIRRDGSSDSQKEEKKRRSKNVEERKFSSSSDEKKRESPKSKETDSKSVTHDTSANGKTSIKTESDSSKTSSVSQKLQFNKLKKNKKTTEIVMEPKDDSAKKIKKQKEEDVAEQYAQAIDKKKDRSALYNKYLQRGGARNPGSKPIPTGADNCLAGLTFLITGVLDSLEREEADELIKQYGGRTVASISKKTDYLVVGDDAGPSKMAKAEQFKTKQISEDGLLDLIKTRPAGKPSSVVQSANHSTSRKRSRSPEKVVKSPTKRSPKVEALNVFSKSIEKAKLQDDSAASTSGYSGQINNSKSGAADSAQALVDKYRPKAMKQIIGQHGDKSNANKLHTWLVNWHKNQGGNVKLTKPSPWAKNDDGAFFKAALLSGPPGVGKTTTAEVVCAELKFDLLEFNASDTRSKKLLKDEVAGILSNTTVKGYFTDNSDHKLTKKHVLLMDEVDGMAGNEDRGGLQELISLIKSSEVPIICICNDRNHPKMRTLANYVFDLRFQKPRIEQIRGAMKSLCCKEKIVISTEDLDRLIQSTNQDIRQIINHLSMLSAGSSSPDNPKGNNINKDLRLGPWDVVLKVFSAEEHAKMSIHDKSNLFFHDYNIAALFVQENYLSVQPKAPKNELLSRVARAADSLAMGDIVENAIRGSNAWSLLPTQACFSSVIPGSLMSGRMAARANFPAWLGRNSRRGKFDRLLQELTVHARLATGASKEAVNLDYLNHLRNAVIRPLTLDKNDGIEEALNVMNHYHLLREDLESLVEVSLWPGQQDPLQAIESKVKAAFTRAYNKSSAPAPFVTNTAAPKRKTAQASQDEGFMDGEDDEDDFASDVDNDDMESDRMIKAKKATTADKTATSSKAEAKPKAKRGRGRGKAK